MALYIRLASLENQPHPATAPVNVNLRGIDWYLCHPDQPANAEIDPRWLAETWHGWGYDHRWGSSTREDQGIYGGIQRWRTIIIAAPHWSLAIVLALFPICRLSMFIHRRGLRVRVPAACSIFRLIHRTCIAASFAMIFISAIAWTLSWWCTFEWGAVAFDRAQLQSANRSASRSASLHTFRFALPRNGYYIALLWPDTAPPWPWTNESIRAHAHNYPSGEWTLRNYPGATRLELAGFECSLVSYHLDFTDPSAPPGPPPLPSAPGVNLSNEAWLIPYWMVILFFCPLPTFWLRRQFRQRQHRRRLADGLCVTCGYDLRASPARCPECGSDPPVRTTIGPPTLHTET